ncbi:DUF5999 family protein (plasmid) [Streptomyces sp. NBC_00989]|nr:DUF5999 family protein [Streptomyces sp. NBC_00989]
MADIECKHTPTCPTAASPDREAAQTVAGHPEQGWSLLCNGVFLFEDTGELLPDGRIVIPHRPTDTLSEVSTLPIGPEDTHLFVTGTAGWGKSALAALHPSA